MRAVVSHCSRLRLGKEENLALEFNPYAAPKELGEPRSADGCWRAGKYIVVPAGFDLPDRCVKCNAPAIAPTKSRTLYWHHWGFYLLILINIVVYALIAFFARKKVRVSPGLCERHKLRRTASLVAAWGGLAMIVVALLTSKQLASSDAVGWLCLVGLISIIAGVVGARILYATRIDASHARLGGSGRAFRESLPAAPLPRG